MGPNAACLLVLGIALTQNARTQNRPTTSDDVAAGAQMFRSHCAQCHGPKGEGGLGPNLASAVFYHGSSDASLLKNISDGIPGTAMPGTFFDTDQVRQIIAYVRSLARVDESASPPGDPSRGRRLFSEKGCGNCHLVRGEGNVLGPDLSIVGSQRSAAYIRQSILEPNQDVSPEYWVAKISVNDGTSYSGFLMNEDTYAVQILDFSRGLLSLSKDAFSTYKIEKSSTMPSYKSQISDDETNDLVSYLCSLKRERNIQ